MLVYEKTMLADEIQTLAAQYGSDRNALLPILQAIQEKYQYISDYAMQETARHLRIHPVEVASVVSFYSFLHSKPQGKNIVRLCRTISCDMAGKQAVEDAIERELGIPFGDTTPDRKVTLEYTNCLGMCDMGPSMLVNDKVYNKLTPEAAVRVICGL